MKKNKYFGAHIVDQQTDRSQAVLYKYAESGRYSGAVKRVIEDMSKAGFGSLVKLAAADLFAWPDARMFPVDTMDNTIASKVYLDGQKDLFPSEVFHKIAERMDTFLDFHGVPDSLFITPAAFQKTAYDPNAISEQYLLPSKGLCKVASLQDLELANSVFEQDCTKLPVPERVEFARNFLKVAKDSNVKLNFKLSDSLTKYASMLDNDVENTRRLLDLRVAAANRIGKSGEEYKKLASTLGEITDTVVSRDELTKLADTIHAVDKKYGFDQKKYDNKMPCAYGVVFNKTAGMDAMDAGSLSSDEKMGMKLKQMSKADIVGHYGDGILESIEDDDGKINYPKFASIVKSLGGGK
jgi:hypothetical protein